MSGGVRVGWRPPWGAGVNGHNNDGKSYFLMSLSQLVSALTLNPLKSLEFFTSTDNSDNMNACFYTVVYSMKTSRAGHSDINREIKCGREIDRSQPVPTPHVKTNFPWLCPSLS